jgi:hypothetical protein
LVSLIISSDKLADYFVLSIKPAIAFRISKSPIKAVADSRMLSSAVNHCTLSNFCQWNYQMLIFLKAQSILFRPAIALLASQWCDLLPDFFGYEGNEEMHQAKQCF